MNLFEGRTADVVWSNAAEQLIEAPDWSAVSGRSGDTRELLHAVLRIEDPRQRWVTSRRPAINPAFALVEAIWILTGRNDSKLPNFWNSALAKFAGDDEVYHGAYGHRLRRHYGFDQLDRAFHILSNTPQSRQVFLQIWDPQLDLPTDDGTPRNSDIPCNIGAHLLVRDGRLEWLQVMRSNDIFLGLPYNLIQFTTIQEVMAGWLGIEPGTYTHISSSLHAYRRDNDVLAIGEATSLMPSDDLALPKIVADESLSTMGQCLDQLASRDLQRQDLAGIVHGAAVPKPYKNILRLVTAEAARRRTWQDDASQIMADCTSQTLSRLWSAWIERLECQGTQRTGRLHRT